jgi:integrase
MARVKDLWAAYPERRGSRGKRWLAVWIDPAGRERSQAFGKKTEAERYASKMEIDIAQGGYVDPKKARITVEQWCETWLEGYGAHRPSTVRQAKVHIRRIVMEFGPYSLGSLRPSQIRSWIARLRHEGLEASYIYALHSRLAQILSDAVHDGLLVKSPCSRRTSPQLGQQRVYVATTGQVWELYDLFPDRIRLAVLLGAFVGLRLAEACGLRPEDIDFLRGIVHPHVQYPAEPLKSNISRTAVPVPSSLVAEFSTQITGYGRHSTLLTGEDGRQLSPWAIERAMRKARKKVQGLPAGFRYHDLRHYFASLLIASGADVKTVQARLRHASAKTTLDTYGHIWPDRDESTRAAVDAVITARTEQRRNSGETKAQRRRSTPI